MIDRALGNACAIVAFSALALSCGGGTIAATAGGRYMSVPIKNGAPKVRIDVYDGARRIAYDLVEWAKDAPDWTASLDLGEVKGRQLEFRFGGDGAQDISAEDLLFTDELLANANCRRDEPLRPQLHFTSPQGWLNDPNGLSYYKGEWHMFYQHNPFGVNHGNMHWGHAVSSDLLHWRFLGDALAPDEHGTMYSGSAATDWDNAAGFGKGAHILAYTGAGGERTQRLAWSLDGRKYTKCPLAAIGARPDANRDPKLFYYAPGRHWVMVVYGKVEKGRHGMSFFVSKNLKDWEKSSHVVGDVIGEGGYLFECPDFFEMPIEGGGGSRWVLTAGNRLYAIGSFDGRVFTPETERLSAVNQVGGGRHIYAWQSFSDAPDGRRIQLAWFFLQTMPGTRGYMAERAGAAPYMFSQGMTLPAELKLVRTKDGLRLARFPVRELATLRDGPTVDFDRFDGELAEVEFSCLPSYDARITLYVRGVKIEYNVPCRVLTVNGAPTAWELDANGRFGLHVFADRLGLEIYSLDGLQYAPVATIVPDPAQRGISLSSGGAQAPMREVSAKAWRLKSVWQVCK